MELMELSDDALVSVLQFVPAKDLFTCRLVCKRIGCLALHWDAWCRRDVEIDCLDAPRARALLHLVPCLQKASVNERDIRALSASKCAVADLTLVGLQMDPMVEMYYTEAVRNQEALGRLRRLHLILEYDYDYDEDAVKDLADAVMACSALVELEVEADSLFTTHPVTQKPPRPSLKKLRCPVGDENLSFVNTLLGGHGATLEEVSLSVQHGCYSDTMPRLLGAMPYLNSLNCTAMPGLQAVAACTLLKKLHLRFRDTSEPTIVHDAAKLLRQAKQLHTVYININALGVAEELILALGSSDSSLKVEDLQLFLSSYDELRALLPTLTSLPALRNLEVTEFIPDDKNKTPADALDKLLLAITPQTAPALSTLNVSLSNFACAHAWIHRESVSEALTMNPSLHILSSGFNDFDCDDCNKSVLAHCHEGVKEERFWKICLFSHDSRKCTSPYHSNAPEYRQWMEIDPNVNEPYESSYDYYFGWW